MHVAKGRALRTLLAAIGVGMLIIGLAGPASAAPSNDNFNTPTVVPQPNKRGPGVSVTGSNVGATVQPGEPGISCGDGEDQTVWFRWSPRRTHNATVHANQRGSNNIDAILAVYRVSPSGLHEIACNDDVSLPTNLNSRVHFEAVRGVTYMVAVDGFTGFVAGGGEGNFTLYFM